MQQLFVWFDALEPRIKRLEKYLVRQEKSRNAPYFAFCICATYGFGAAMGFVFGLVFRQLSGTLATLLDKVFAYGP